MIKRVRVWLCSVGYACTINLWGDDNKLFFAWFGIQSNAGDTSCPFFGGLFLCTPLTTLFIITKSTHKSNDISWLNMMMMMMITRRMGWMGHRRRWWCLIGCIVQTMLLLLSHKQTCIGRGCSCSSRSSIGKHNIGSTRCISRIIPCRMMYNGGWCSSMMNKRGLMLHQYRIRSHSATRRVLLLW